MQGAQSNSTPEHRPGQRPDQTPIQSPDQPGRLASASGPLEAARRYTERQRANEAIQAAIDDEESDGRPAWLRRWPSEVRREIATERWRASRSTAPKLAEKEQAKDRASADLANTNLGDTNLADTDLAAASLPASTPISALDSKPDASPGVVADGTYANGYTGQSIEAAFPFDTVYRFETEFEAEANEDWLNVSGDRASVDELKSSDTPDATPDFETAMEPHRRAFAQDDAVAPGALPSSGSASVVDPQAVRAAIFRLVQEAAIGHGGGGLAGTVPERPRLERIEDQWPEFAEVALGLWEGAGTDGNADRAEEAHSEGRFESPSDVALDRTGPDGKRTWASEVQPAPHSTSPPVNDGDISEIGGDGHTGATMEAFATPQPHRSETSQPELPCPSLDSVSGSATLGSKLVSPAPELEATSALGKASYFSGEGTDAPIAASTPGREPQASTADSSPALAHDAGNLLSALNLYSELLALSGVLDARHKHYAEDLKLLAARSEVLISRLLAVYRVAENEARTLARESRRNPAISTSSDGPAVAIPGQNTSASRQEGGVVDQASEDIAKELSEVQTVYAAADEVPKGGEEIDRPFDLEPADLGPERPTTASATSQEERDDPIEVAPLNLVDLLTRWRSLLSTIGHSSIEVNFGPNAVLPVRIKEETMERILVNVVHNAMTATRRGGSIRIGVGRIEKRRTAESMPSSDGRAQPGSRMVVTVDDSGCGMTEEQIAQIFAAGPTQTEGLRNLADLPRRGMGLQIVRELIAASGGTLAIYSRCGAGTRIEMEWPTVEAGAGLERIPPASVGADGVSSRVHTHSSPPRQFTAAEDFVPDSSRQAGSPPAYSVKGAIAC